MFDESTTRIKYDIFFFHLKVVKVILCNDRSIKIFMFKHKTSFFFKSPMKIYMLSFSESSLNIIKMQNSDIKSYKNFPS